MTLAELWETMPADLTEVVLALAPGLLMLVISASVWLAVRVIRWLDRGPSTATTDHRRPVPCSCACHRRGCPTRVESTGETYGGPGRG